MQIMIKEKWVPVIGFEDRYRISNKGRLFTMSDRKKKARMLRPYIGSNGYYKTHLYKNGLAKQVYIHTLVAENFISQKPNGRRMTVNHKDCNQLNNICNNLEWIEQGDNIRHAAKNGLMAKGERHGRAKLMASQVLKIRELSSIENFSCTRLAKTYKVSIATISLIVNNKIWT